MDFTENASLGVEKPGWVFRLFGVETARLIACDARRDRAAWTRPPSFAFLYRTRGGSFHLLSSAHDSRLLSEPEARALYDRLPTRLVRDEDAFPMSPIE